MTAESGHDEDPLAELFAGEVLIRLFLASALGPPDHRRYYGRRDIGDGRSVAVIALTFARARLVVVDDRSDCPIDGW